MMEKSRIDILGRVINRDQMDRDNAFDPEKHARNEAVRQLVVSAMRSVETAGGITEYAADETTEEIVKLFY
jgi:hypothetical protein